MSAHSATPSTLASRKSWIPPARWTSSAAAISKNKLNPVLTRALLTSALFYFLGLCSPLFAEQVIAVFDGDTIKLKDQRIIRIIGIDTPELGRRGKPGQPYAQTSKKRLAELIRQSNFEVELFFDAQRKDRYHRELAYVQLADGRDAGKILLREGLATLLVIPPNVSRANHYAGIESKARKQRRNIWKEADRQPILASELTGTETGYHIIQGTVSALKTTRYNYWLTLDDKLTIKLTRKDARHYFKAATPEKLRRKKIEVRGRLYHHRKQQRLRLRHPAYLKIM